MKKSIASKIRKAAQRSLLCQVAILTTFLLSFPVHGSDRGQRARGSKASQGILLETVQQDLVIQRLAALSQQFDLLLEDSKANGSLDPRTEMRVKMYKTRVKQIENGPLASAVELLRLAFQKEGKEQLTKVNKANKYIDVAAWEMGRLLLMLNVRYATDVYARELHEIYRREEDIYSLTLDVAESIIEMDRDEFRQLSGRQRDTADRLIQMSKDARQPRPSARRYLAQVRLLRASKALREQEMFLSDAARDVGEKKAKAAVVKQGLALKGVEEVQVKLNPEFQMILLEILRDDIRAIIDAQQAMRKTGLDLEGDQIGIMAHQRGLLRKTSRLRVPMKIKDKTFQLSGSEERQQAAQEEEGREQQQAMGSGIDYALQEAASAMKRAVAAVKAMDKATLEKEQKEAATNLASAVEIITDRITALVIVDNVTRMRNLAAERQRSIKYFDNMQLDIQDQIDELMAGQLSDEVVLLVQADAVNELMGFMDRLDDSQTYVPLLKRDLNRALEKMRVTVTSIQGKKLKDAIMHCEKASEAIQRAFKTAEYETIALGKRVEMRTGIMTLANFRMHAYDVEAEQRDVMRSTKNASEDLTSLVEQEEILSFATDEAGQLAAVVGMDTKIMLPLMQAQQLMTSASEKIEKNDMPGAVPMQNKAEALLRQSQIMSKMRSEQYEIIAELLELLQRIQADTLDVLQRQRLLHEENDKSAPGKLPGLVDRQEELRMETIAITKVVPEQLGRESHQTASGEMGLSSGSLKAKSSEEAGRHMKLAEDALEAALARIEAVVLITSELAAELVDMEIPVEIQALMRAFELAGRQRAIRQETMASTHPEDITDLRLHQEDLEKDTVKASQEFSIYDAFGKAAAEMQAAIVQLKGFKPKPGIKHQRKAEQILMELVMELVAEMESEEEEDILEEQEEMLEVAMSLSLTLEFSPTEELPPMDAMSLMMMPPSDVELEDEMEQTKEAVEGRDPRRRRSDWRIIARRERAALNENFARELPLEYGDVLKDYYMRLAE